MREAMVFLGRVTCALLIAAGPATAQVAGPAPVPMPAPDAIPGAAPTTPAPPAPTTPAPATAPAPGVAPTLPAAPAPAATPAPMPAAMMSGAGPGLVPPSQPPASSSRLGRGLTLELALGLGWIRLAPERREPITEDATGGLNLGVGLWISPRDALTLRIAGATHKEKQEGELNCAFIGPSLQHWLDDRIWMGVGLGLGVVSLKYADELALPDPEPKTGLGLDLRAGFAFVSWGQNQLSASFELTPVLLEDGSVTAAGLLLAYQYL